jgi:hypothetical protein
MSRSTQKSFIYKTFCQADGWYAVIEKREGEATIQQVVGWATLDGEGTSDDEIVGLVRDPAPEAVGLYPVGSFNDYFAGFVHGSELKGVRDKFPELKIKFIPVWVEAAS